MDNKVYTLQSATAAAVALSNSRMSNSSTSTDDQSGISSADVSVCSTTSTSSISDVCSEAASTPQPTQAIQAFGQQQQRLRPGGPQRVQQAAVVGPSDTVSTAIERHLTFDDDDTSDNIAIHTDDRPYEADANANIDSLPANDVTTASYNAASEDEPNHSGYTNELHLDETERLLDTPAVASTSTSNASTSTQAEPRFNRRVSRVRTLSGTPLSVPMNCSAAVLRHGLGTALSTNTGAVDDDQRPASKRYTQKTTASSTASAKYEEIGTRKNIKWDADLLIEGVLFRASYLGSTQLACDGQPTKHSRMLQAEEAVARIKVPDDEHQPSTEVDLCISTLKIMVLNTNSQDVIMDPALRTISYIADIGDLVVLMARRPLIRSVADTTEAPVAANSTIHSSAQQPAPKILCHVFESTEALLIAQTIGQAFQVAYSEFLRANGIATPDDDALADRDRDPTLDTDYQAVLNSQAIAGDELEVFTHKERQKEITVTKAAGELLGLVLVESGWGSLLPTAVVANMQPAGAAARGGEMCIGDQIIAVNGASVVGLPLAECVATIGRAARGSRSVQFTLVPCAPVVEVMIRRPSTRFQLGFSVQMGVVCSLLRGGIAERGGVRVGHRIIEINEQSVVAVTHERIVSVLASAVGEIRMKTMPVSMFRLLTGQENPTYI